MKIEEFLKQEGEKTRQVVAAYFDEVIGENNELPFGGMLEALKAYVLAGGKYARPTLMRLAHEAVGGKSMGDTILASAAIEVFHRFILSHDDIIDQDMTRHNHPTMERYFREKQDASQPAYPVELYDKGMAIVSGDLLHSLSLDMIERSGLETNIQLQLIRGLHDCLMATAAGWKLETELKQLRLSEVKKDDVFEAMRLVSGYYSVLWPLRLGQLLAGRKLGEWEGWLEIYGEEVGIAFQIQDDILGMFGDSKVTGKPVGSDFREGKKTILLMEAYGKAGKADKAFLDAALGSDIEEEIERVQEIMKSTGAVEAAQNEATERVGKAMKQVPDDAAAVKLKDIAEFLITRDR